jgi:Ser/Thr protein kinase RdoA (MazF antagonist)
MPVPPPPSARPRPRRLAAPRLTPRSAPTQGRPGARAPRAHNAPYYRLETTAGRYFVKRFKRFTPNADRGLDLAVFLHRRGYPAVEVMLTVDAAPHVTHHGAAVALFEYLELPVSTALGVGRATALGAALGALHALAADFPPPLPETFLGHAEFAGRLAAVDPPAWMPAAVRDLIAAAQRAFPALAARPDQPRGACHHEFGLEHTRFRGDAVAKVIDWDLVGDDYLFHDLGTTMTEAVGDDGIDFPALGALLRGYDQRRPLTVWERAHLYEALRYGACKYLTWSLEDEVPAGPAIPGWALGGIGTAAAVLTLGKTGFDHALRPWFPSAP